MKLAEALDAERRRISADLHDRTGPNLAAIALNLATIEHRLRLGSDADVHALLAESRALLGDTIAGLRDLCAELRPARLEYSGLVPALTERIDQFRKRTGLDVQWQVQGLGEAAQAALGAESRDGLGPRRRRADHEWLIFRAVQEALTNCAKHARARRVTVQLQEEAASLVLRVEDDGQGFDPRQITGSTRPPGLGLLTMRERVEEAHGSFELQSRPGEGTRIRIRLPRASGPATPP